MQTSASSSVNFSFVIVHNVLVLPEFIKAKFKCINSVT